MLDMVRNGLARVAGIRAFFTVHQPADPALVVLSAKLDAGDHRAAELIRSRGEHEVEGRTATEHAKKARRRLGRGLLPLFARAGLAAARTKPELLASFRSLSPRVTNLDFAAAAGSLIEATKANLEVLADHGVSAKMVEEAAALLEQYVTKDRPRAPEPELAGGGHQGASGGGDRAAGYRGSDGPLSPAPVRRRPPDDGGVGERPNNGGSAQPSGVEGGVGERHAGW